MEAILKFNLDDPDDKIAHYRCVKALDMAMVLFEIQMNLWKNCKKAPAVQEVFNKINELIEDHNINLDELIV